MRGSVARTLAAALGGILRDEEWRGGESAVSRSAGAGDAEPVADCKAGGDGGEEETGEEGFGEAEDGGINVGVDGDASGDVGGEFGRGSSSAAAGATGGSGAAVREAADPCAVVGGVDDALLTVSSPVRVVPGRCGSVVAVATCESSFELRLLRTRSSNEGRALRVGRIPSCIQCIHSLSLAQAVEVAVIRVRWVVEGRWRCCQPR